MSLPATSEPERPNLDLSPDLEGVAAANAAAEAPSTSLTTGAASTQANPESTASTVPSSAAAGVATSNEGPRAAQPSLLEKVQADLARSQANASRLEKERAGLREQGRAFQALSKAARAAGAAGEEVEGYLDAATRKAIQNRMNGIVSQLELCQEYVVRGKRKVAAVERWGTLEPENVVFDEFCVHPRFGEVNPGFINFGTQRGEEQYGTYDFDGSIVFEGTCVHPGCEEWASGHCMGARCRRGQFESEAWCAKHLHARWRKRAREDGSLQRAEIATRQCNWCQGKYERKRAKLVPFREALEQEPAGEVVIRPEDGRVWTVPPEVTKRSWCNSEKWTYAFPRYFPFRVGDEFLCGRARHAAKGTWFVVVAYTPRRLGAGKANYQVPSVVCAVRKQCERKADGTLRPIRLCDLWGFTPWFVVEQMCAGHASLLEDGLQRLRDGWAAAQAEARFRAAGGQRDEVLIDQGDEGEDDEPNHYEGEGEGEEGEGEGEGGGEEGEGGDDSRSEGEGVEA